MRPGDVIDVGYLDTTLWEIGGEYLSTDHPSGRPIKFPNSKVLNSAVYNYSWPLFPYIWNELKFQYRVRKRSEIRSKTMREIAEEEIGAAMLDCVQTFRSLFSETPVDELEVREQTRRLVGREIAAPDVHDKLFRAKFSLPLGRHRC